MTIYQIITSIGLAIVFIVVLIVVFILILKWKKKRESIPDETKVIKPSTKIRDYSKAEIPTRDTNGNKKICIICGGEIQDCHPIMAITIKDGLEISGPICRRCISKN